MTGLWEGFPAALSCLRDCPQRSCCSVQARFRFWGPCRAPFWEIIPSFIPMLFWTELLLRYSALPLASVSPLRQLFCWQGSIYLLASVIEPFITDALMTEISLVGGILILSSGLGILGIKQIRTLNLLPALLVPPVVIALLTAVGLG